MAAGASGAGFLGASFCLAEEKAKSGDYESPYEGIAWDQCQFLHSMSHQHQGTNDISRDLFLAMGYGHFAFSNYYPSRPIYPLPESWSEKHPEIIAAPNAEQHSFTDYGLHANSLGSLFSSGYGAGIPTKGWTSSPIEHRVSDFHRFTTDRPWEGVYRIDIRFTSKSKEAQVRLTVEGATECNPRQEYAEVGAIQGKALDAGRYSIPFRVNADEVLFRLEFDPEQITFTELRLMQGTYRPWRDAFLAILDGEVIDGEKRGGLLYADGGGITLNHPTGKMENYVEMLDFDPRVLGIEVWNHLSSGFGASGYVDSMDGTPPPHYFYDLWDQILATGRRCWGFFVKDHTIYGRGRNVLLVPSVESASREEKEATALRAYRNGSFFGAVSAIALNEEGKVDAPYDHSDFRFRRINLRRDVTGKAEALEVEVGDQDVKKRPNLQIRFVTEEGTVLIVDGDRAEFPLNGDKKPQFVRIEAIAYPSQAKGEPLTSEKIRKLSVAEISRIHDKILEKQPIFFGNPVETRVPVPTVDLIFSQAIRRI